MTKNLVKRCYTIGEMFIFDRNDRNMLLKTTKIDYDKNKR